MPARTPYSKLISEAATGQGLDPALIEALVIQESAGQADSFRFEPKFYARYMAKVPAWAGHIPRRISSSYGLMQIMYLTAWELGFRDEPEALFVPTTNLLWGCRKFKQLQDWANSKTDKPDLARLSALAAYNGGRADNEPGHLPMLRNGQYANSVLRIYNGLR